MLNWKLQLEKQTTKTLTVDPGYKDVALQVIGEKTPEHHDSWHADIINILQITNVT